MHRRKGRIAVLLTVVVAVAALGAWGWRLAHPPRRLTLLTEPLQRTESGWIRLTNLELGPGYPTGRPEPAPGWLKPLLERSRFLSRLWDRTHPAYFPGDRSVRYLTVEGEAPIPGYPYDMRMDVAIRVEFDALTRNHPSYAIDREIAEEGAFAFRANVPVKPGQEVRAVEVRVGERWVRYPVRPRRAEP